MDLKQVITEQHFDYLAQYTVVKRASLEENFHEVTFSLVVPFTLSVVLEVYKGYRRAPSCEEIGKTYDHSNQCTPVEQENSASIKREGSLKESWKLARPNHYRFGHPSKALRSFLEGTDSALFVLILVQDCILDAYEHGSLIAVVPFVSKVLQQGRKSQWFKPPNPWVMAILKLMIELYNTPHIVQEIKFEVEILTNSLEIEIPCMQ